MNVLMIGGPGDGKWYTVPNDKREVYFSAAVHVSAEWLSRNDAAPVSLEVHRYLLVPRLSRLPAFAAFAHEGVTDPLRACLRGYRVPAELEEDGR